MGESLTSMKAAFVEINNVHVCILFERFLYWIRINMVITDNFSGMLTHCTGGALFDCSII